MKHKEQELQTIKDEIYQMWSLVISQTEKSKAAFLQKNIELAMEVNRLEKRVNVFELKIERSCENYIALYNPVAIDLRLILSIMKISTMLERIADYANGIALHVLDKDCNQLDYTLVDELALEKMFELLLNMLADSFISFQMESTQTSGKILLKDKEINAIYDAAFQKLESYMSLNPREIHCGLKLILLIRKMERMGDLCSNIVEEIVFYVEAKVLKHKGKTEES